MSKFVLISALAMLSLPAAAVAKDKVDPRIAKSLQCTTIADGPQRLACYDQAMAGLKQALEEGELMSTAQFKPKALEGTVVASGGLGFNRFWVELDTGDRWELITGSMNDVPPRRGAKAKLRKSLMRNYFYTDTYSPNFQARFLGRRD
jgi:hypothetical protein